MSCLPLFSFNSSILTAFRPYGSPPVSELGGQEPEISVTLSESSEELESPYDKLSQVSVSHRRVDSFEWVMTHSAPNTPPTMGDSTGSYSPPLERLIESAPLPVPNENWSTYPNVCEGKERRGYFDWWSSPSLENGQGYFKISQDERRVERSSKPPARSAYGSRTSYTVKAQVHIDPVSHAHSTDLSSSTMENNQLGHSHEFNALGIVFSDIPSPSPLASICSKSLQSQDLPAVSSQVSAPRLPKRVSFSPIVYEVVLEAFPNLESPRQQQPSWGSYLPSSFLVARPPLLRTSSSPAPKGKTAIRPILRRSTSLNHQPGYDSSTSTEMTSMLAQSNAKDAVAMISPMPTQRLSTTASRADNDEHVGEESNWTDKAFVSLLQTAQRPARVRCDSLLSNKSSDFGEEHKSL